MAATPKFRTMTNTADPDSVRSKAVAKFKLVKTWKTRKLELFDLSKDLSEAHDLSLAMQEKTKELDRTLSAFLNEAKATTVQTKIGKDE